MNNLNQIKLIVDEQSNLVRIDKLLCLHLDDLTRTRIVALIENGNITVNSKSVSKNYKVKTGDEICACVPEPVEYEAKPENIDW